MIAFAKSEIHAISSGQDLIEVSNVTFFNANHLYNRDNDLTKPVAHQNVSRVRYVPNVFL
jgi:hypothetical protein